MNHPELMSSFTAGLDPCFTMARIGSEVFNHHERLSYDRCFLWTSVVPGGSVGLNHPELMSRSTTGLVPSVVLWFE